jgi:uncharacterized heparinase superfamily protein
LNGKIARYWHTLRHLKAVQFYGRARLKLTRSRVDLRAAPALRAAGTRWAMPVSRVSGWIGPMRFRFLNETHDLNDPSGWDDPSIEKLWRYNLHYFDYLNGRSEGAFLPLPDRLLVDQWIADNPPAVGTGWEPFPTSLRIVNWIKWALAGNALSDRQLHSLAVQTRWLAGRLEIHLLGNHLFANAKALVFAGLFFDGAEAAGWLSTGTRLLEKQIPEQILADGAHFERSTMYHALALEDVLDIVNVANCFNRAIPPGTQALVDACLTLVPAMRDWLAWMSHPDGEISFFNDAAMSIAATARELDLYAERLGFAVVAEREDGLRHFAESGYVAIQRGALVAMLDVAPVGPDYLPGHAHADTLSFELSLYGERVFVNSGISQYGLGQERLRQRGTAAHNTVLVDGEDSTEVWSGFRVARRAKPFDLKISEHDGLQVVVCSHDGYTRLPGKNIHRRTWIFGPNTLTLEDELSGKFNHAEVMLHLHPNVKIAHSGERENQILLTLPRGQLITLAVEGGTFELRAGTWHPMFGISLPNQCLVTRMTVAKAKISMGWKLTY